MWCTALSKSGLRVLLPQSLCPESKPLEALQKTLVGRKAGPRRLLQATEASLQTFKSEISWHRQTHVFPCLSAHQATRLDSLDSDLIRKLQPQRKLDTTCKQHVPASAPLIETTNMGPHCRMLNGAREYQLDSRIFYIGVVASPQLLAAMTMIRRTRDSHHSMSM